MPSSLSPKSCQQAYSWQCGGIMENCMVTLKNGAAQHQQHGTQPLLRLTTCSNKLKYCFNHGSKTAGRQHDINIHSSNILFELLEQGTGTDRQHTVISRLPVTDSSVTLRPVQSQIVTFQKQRYDVTQTHIIISNPQRSSSAKIEVQQEQRAQHVPPLNQ